jgi:hypothetical protein
MRSSSEQSMDGPRKQLNPRIDKMIAAYATAAGAVGVALLASAPTAEAEIIYTKAHVTVGDTERYHLDLNHDGIGDFSIGFCSCRPHGTALTVARGRSAGNMIIEQTNGHGRYSAGALNAGAPIGPKQAFTTYSAQMVSTGSYGSGPYSNGPWANVSDRYLGLKFMISGEVHYGWARMTVGKRFDHVLLTGYAYETIPNKPLKAGQTSETPDADEAESPISWSLPAQGPSLGMLALGADALQIWCKKEEGVS